MASSRDLEQQDSFPVLCTNNCGFFGSPRTNNLCTVCYNRSLPSSDALPSAPPRRISLLDEFPPASTIVNRPASGIHASPVEDTPALPSRTRFVFSVPPEGLSNGQATFGSGGQVVFGGGGSSGQSSSPWRFSREPIFFTSFGFGNVLPPSSTDPQVHQLPGRSPHPSSCPVPETPHSASASPVPVPQPWISPRESSLGVTEPSLALRESALAVPEPSLAPQASSFPVPEPSQGGSVAKRNRCHSCRKRLCLGLTFKCRCGDVFCSSHRFPDQHGCTLDIKARQREAIARGNPVIKADKLQGRI